MIIGVTGGVGTGKSTILEILKEEYQAAVIIADDVARELMLPGHQPYQDIITVFGQDLLTDGENSPIDRGKLAGIVFQNPELLKRLNQCVHPAVKEYISAQIASLQEKGISLIVVETAILIEAGYLPLVDQLWVVHTDYDVRVQRLMESRGYTKEKTDQIIRNQMDPVILEEKADFVIDNSKDLDNVREQIRNYFMHERITD